MGGGKLVGDGMNEKQEEAAAWRVYLAAVKSLRKSKIKIDCIGSGGMDALDVAMAYIRARIAAKAMAEKLKRKYKPAGEYDYFRVNEKHCVASALYQVLFADDEGNSVHPYSVSGRFFLVFGMAAVFESQAENYLRYGAEKSLEAMLADLETVNSDDREFMIEYMIGL